MACHVNVRWRIVVGRDKPAAPTARTRPPRCEPRRPLVGLVRGAEVQREVPAPAACQARAWSTSSAGSRGGTSPGSTTPGETRRAPARDCRTARRATNSSGLRPTACTHRCPRRGVSGGRAFPPGRILARLLGVRLDVVCERQAGRECRSGDRGSEHVQRARRGESMSSLGRAGSRWSGTWRRDGAGLAGITPIPVSVGGGVCCGEPGGGGFE
jgi:hypothetical protein